LAPAPLTQNSHGNNNTNQLDILLPEVIVYGICSSLIFHVMEYHDEEELNEEGHPLFFQWMEGDSLAPPCHSEHDVIDPMLQFLEQQVPLGFLNNEKSLFYDLGCGDGRVCISATRRFGCQSVGVEIEDFLIKRFQAAIERQGLHGKVCAVHGDLRDLTFDIRSEGTVISMYLLPEAIELIRPLLLTALEAGAIVVCNSWGIKGLPVAAKGCGGESGNVNFFLYTKDCLVV
jgi:SAM-dependent methyltransferase